MRLPHPVRNHLSWLTLAAFMASGPTAWFSHDHGDCCRLPVQRASLGVRAEDAAGIPARGATRRHAGCRFTACRHARSSAQASDRFGGAHSHDRSSSFSSACFACEFLAKQLSVMTWSLPEASVLGRWIERPVRPPASAAAFAASFLARGPPA